MAESALVRATTRELTRRGAWWTNIHGAGTGRNGIQDFLACYRGRFLAIETKAERGQLRPLQRRELELVQRAGGTAIVARTIHDVRQALDRIDLIADLGDTTRTEAA